MEKFARLVRKLETASSKKGAVSTSSTVSQLSFETLAIGTAEPGYENGRENSEVQGCPKTRALRKYFASASDEDAAWALWLLAGHKPKRCVSAAVFRVAAIECSGVPLWLYEQCEKEIEDPGEAIALIAGGGGSTELSKLNERSERIVAGEQKLAAMIAPICTQFLDLEDEAKSAEIQSLWRASSRDGIRIVNDLLQGRWSSPISLQLLGQVVAEDTAQSLPHVLRQLATFEPTLQAYRSIRSLSPSDENPWQLCPFSEVRVWEGAVDVLPAIAECRIEEVRSGTRIQLIRTDREVAIWSETQEWITKKQPHLVKAAQTLPVGTTLEGVLYLNADGSSKHGWQAWDCVEWQGEDLQARPWMERLTILERALSWMAPDSWSRGSVLSFESWEALWAYRNGSQKRCSLRILSWRGSAGAVTATTAAIVPNSDKRVEWHVHTAECTVDVVLLYANLGDGEYTFAVRSSVPGQGLKREGGHANVKEGESDAGALIAVARVATQLDEVEQKKLERWITKNTREKFGPVRSVEPVQVFELAFEGVQKSARHKSGIVLRAPRVLRWKKDADASRVASLETLQGFVEGVAGLKSQGPFSV